MDEFEEKLKKNEKIYKADIKEYQRKTDERIIETLVNKTKYAIINAVRTTYKKYCYTDLLYYMNALPQEKRAELIDATITKLKEIYPDIIIEHKYNNQIFASWE